MNTLRHLVLSAFALAGACAVFGCNSLLPGVANLSAKSAENPLSGPPLEWSHDPSGVPFEGERACTVWPIRDSLTVKATETEICADGEIYKLIDAKFSPTTGEQKSLQVESDGSGESGLGAGVADGAIRAPLQKVGSCVDKSTGQKNVWVARFSTVCIPNKGMGGAQVLTPKSTFLQVGDARWKFSVAPSSASR